MLLGSPLLYYNPTKMIYTQIGLVSGAIGECGDGRFPGVYVRINHPEIMGFIHSVTSLYPDAGKTYTERVADLNKLNLVKFDSALVQGSNKFFNISPAASNK